MRTTAALVIAASVLLIPPAAMTAIVAPFGLDHRVPVLRQLFSIMLMLSPFLLLAAGVHAFLLIRADRQITIPPLVAFATAVSANALFWLGV